MADADHYSVLQAEAAALADEMEAIIHDIRPEKTILQGSTGSRRAGNGLEFFEMVDFNPEDHDRTQIDARTSARKDEDYVRLPEDEALIQCVLWRATGPNMAFSSGGLDQAPRDENGKPALKDRLLARVPGALRNLFGAAAKAESGDTIRASLNTGALRTKQDAADILLMATARLLLSETQANQVMLLNGSGSTYSSRQHIDNLAIELYESQEPSQIGSEASDETRHLRRNAKVFLFSDCLHSNVDEDALQAELDAEKDKEKHPEIFARHYTAAIVNDIEHMQAHDVRGHLVHIFDPLEWDFPVGKDGLPDGRLRLEWDGGENELSRAREMRMDYLKRVHAVQKALHSALESMEWGYSMYVTNQPLINGLTPLIGVINDESVRTFDPEKTLAEGLAQEQARAGRKQPQPKP
jgi:hypothetical protein